MKNCGSLQVGAPGRAVGRLARVFVLCVSLIGLAAWGGDASAATITSTAAGGNWNAAGTWVGGVVPASTDSVIIATTGAGVVNVNVQASMVNITVNSGSVLTVVGGSNFRLRPTGTTSISGTLNIGTTTSSYRFSGVVTLNAGGVWTNTGNTPVNFRGGLTNNGGTFTAGTGIQSFTNTAQAIGGTSPISIPNLTVTTIALTNNGTLTVPTALAGSGSLINSATGTLDLGGTSAITTLTANAVGNTVNYTGAAQTVKATIYHNLGLGGSGAKTMGATTINGNFTMSGTATTAPTGALTVGGNFTIGAGTTFTAGALLHSVKGNWSNSGTFTAGTSTVTLNGTAMQTVTGTNTFSKLTLTNAVGVTISGNTTVTGTFTPGTTPITVNTGSTLIIGATTYTGPCSGTYGAGYCTSPTVKSINTANPNPTAGATPVSWTVVFGTNVTGVTAANFALVQGGGVSGAAITSVTGGANTWTVTANAGTGSGTLGLNMVNTTGVSPALTNLPFPGALYTIDRNPPAVSSIALANPDPTGLASVSWNVTFSKSVTGVATTDFVLVQGGVSGAAITGVAGSGASWTVTASTGIGNGTLGLNLIDNDTIIDSASVPLGGPGLSNGNFTGAVYTVSRPVRYYHDTTAGVNIGFDGVTNVTGANQVIPPIITASLLTTSACAGVARSASHPVGLYTHSRWYLTTNYAVATNIAANPTGSAFLRGQLATDTVVVSLYDYDPVSGGKTLIGSSPIITLTGAGTTTAYSYTISSVRYTVPSGHRLMLQYDFNQPVATDRARVYCSAASAYLAVVETPATTCFTDNFNRADGAPAGNWVVANEGGTFGNPAIVANRLRLTDASNSVSTMAALQQLFPAAGNKITVEFNHFAYGGNGADGIGVVLSDAGIAPVPGAFGGSLGYAPKQVALGGDTTHPGFAGGWLGLALDEYGNFSANTEGRSGGAAPGLTIDSAAVRGSGSGYAGYPYHRGTATLAPTIDAAGATPAPGYRYRITIDHSNGVNAMTSVERDTTGTGTAYSYLISPYDAKAEAGQAAVPTNWFLSFTGSTGASTNIHEIDDLQVCSSNPQPMPTLDHIRLVHDGAGLTCSAETVTVKACANAACDTLYLGAVTVNMTAITGATWSSPSVTFTGGQARVTLTSGAGTVTLGGTAASPTAASLTRCFSGTTETCSLTYTAATACFDAVEKAANAATNIFTKLSATGFSLDVLAANSGVVNTGYVGTIAMDLVDPAAASGNCNDTNAGLTGAVNYTFTAVDTGRHTFNFNYPTAAANVRVRIRDTSVSPAQPNCSTDNFAIRPSAVTLNIAPGMATPPSAIATPTIKAGASFTLTAITSPADGYAGTLTLDAGKLTAQTTAQDNTVQSGGTVGTLTPASLAANTLPSNNAGYTEAGYLYLAPGVFRDDGYTSVDQPSGCAATNSCDCVTDTTSGANLADTIVSGKYGCSIGNKTGYSFGRFVPDHFDTAAIGSMACAAGAGCAAPVTTMAYSGQPFGVQVTAKNAGGNTTKNYQGKFAKAVTLSAVASNGGAAIPAAAPGGALGANAVAAADFASGSNALTLANPVFTFAAAPTAPTDVFVRAVEAPGDGVSSLRAVAANSVEGGVKVVSGRVKVANAYGSELLDLPMTVTVQYYDGTNWLKSGTDSVTSLTLALSNYQCKTGCAWTTTPTPASGQVMVGGLSFKLTKPNGGGTGSVDVSINAPDYLLTASNGALVNPSKLGRATFGVYQGRKEFIYLRENY